jgi:predicted lipoprotein with Yx(FWY)xxD motif
MRWARDGRLLITLAVAASVLAACGSGKKVAAGSSAQPASAAAAARVDAAANAKLGKTVLVDAGGMTLYRNAQETAGTVVCTGACAKTWLPLLTPAGTTPVAGAGVAGALALLTRPDGGIQVTFDGMPLYLFGGDRQPGDVSGQGLGQIWFAVPAAGGSAASSGAATSGGHLDHRGSGEGGDEHDGRCRRDRDHRRHRHHGPCRRHPDDAGGTGHDGAGQLERRHAGHAHQRGHDGQHRPPDDDDDRGDDHHRRRVEHDGVPLPAVLMRRLSSAGAPAARRAGAWPSAAG